MDALWLEWQSIPTLHRGVISTVGLNAAEAPCPICSSVLGVVETWLLDLASRAASEGVALVAWEKRKLESRRP